MSTPARRLTTGRAPLDAAVLTSLALSAPALSAQSEAPAVYAPVSINLEDVPYPHDTRSGTSLSISMERTSGWPTWTSLRRGHPTAGPWFSSMA